MTSIAYIVQFAESVLSIFGTNEDIEDLCLTLAKTNTNEQILSTKYPQNRVTSHFRTNFCIIK